MPRTEVLLVGESWISTADSPFNRDIASRGRWRLVPVKDAG